MTHYWLDQLVGPTVHYSLIDVLLRFHHHRVALTTDVSRMYRGVELVPSDRDLHRFKSYGEAVKLNLSETIT